MKAESIYSALRDWLGVGPEYTVQEVGLRSSLPHVLLPIAVVAAFVFAAYLYRRESRLPRSRKVLLALLRGLACTIFICILFEPFVGLSRQLTIRRSLLVLLDRSQSMAIADARKKPQDLADAALALGAVPFPAPERQEAAARAARAMGDSAAALKQNRFDEARAAQLAARQILGAAAGEEAAPAAGAAAGGEALATFQRGLRSAEQQQEELCSGTARLDKEGKLNPDRYRELAGAQEKILQDLAAALAALQNAPLPVPAGSPTNLAASARAALARGLVAHPQAKVFDHIAAGGYAVRFFAFGERLEPIGAAADDYRAAVRGLAATARATTANAIEDAVAQMGGQPLAGVVLLTDGAFNAGAVPQEAARRLKEQGIPLFPVGIGLKAPDDVGLRSLMAPDAIFPKDEVRARVQVFAQGYAGAKAAVRVWLDNAEVAQKQVELGDEPQFLDLPFKVPEGRSGTAALAVTVAEQPGEITAANNRVEKRVRLIDQKIKVLYVEGKPRWEYRYLRVVLQRDPRLEVKFLMTQGDPELPLASPEYIGRYPENADEAFGYDLVILGDVPAWYFSKPQIERLVQLVRERGGSLLMLAGDDYAPASYVNTPLAEVLPVRIADGSETVATNVFPVPTERGKQSLALLDPSEDANLRIWSAVCPLYRLPNLEGAKPAANVLLDIPPGPGRSQSYPLVAWHYAGTGKAMYVGTDQLWRLRFKSGDQYHARFWGQAIQFLALSRLLGENKRIRIEADRNELRAGERLEVHATVLNEFYDPILAPEYTVQLARAAETNAGAAVSVPIPVRLTAVPGSPGLYQGRCTPPQEGRYTLRARPEDAAFAGTAEVTVAAADPEQREPAMQEALLRGMAEASGGRYFRVCEWPTLPGILGGKERTVVEQETVNVWDRWPPYVLLVLCLGLEWWIRRRHHLV